MAKSRPTKKSKVKKKQTRYEGPSPEVAGALLEQSAIHLQAGQPEEALGPAKKALQYLLDPSLETPPLAALELLGQIYLEIGNPEKAREYFTHAVDLDPDGEVLDEDGGGADKFLWLAQLSEEGGTESIKWFDKGSSVLRRDINMMESKSVRSQAETATLEAKRKKLANALCGAAEVYMTDLSWEEDAEGRCEALVTEACMVAPHNPEPLQTLASIRISQTDFKAARSALARSLDLWSNLPPQDTNVPEFPTRISLARLLIEADMQDKALEVLERLVAEDDSSVEAWYLGGWCQYLIAENQATDIKVENDSSRQANDSTPWLRRSRKWLLQSLKLYDAFEYEDERLQEHAQELVQDMNQKLGPPKKGADDKEDDDDDDDDGWEDDDDGEDNEADEDGEMDET